MGLKLNETNAVFTFPGDEFNYDISIEVTEEGILLDDGYELLPWEWIDKALEIVAIGKKDLTQS